MRFLTKIIAGLSFTSLLHAATIVGAGRGIEQNYAVKKGDSLWKISQSFYGTGFRAEQLKRHNGLKGDLITEGQKIALPALYLRLMVSKGDTLSTISEEYFCGASRYRILAEYNRISSPYHIREGQIIRLPLYRVGGLMPCDKLIVRGGGTVEPARAKLSAKKRTNKPLVVSYKTKETTRCGKIESSLSSTCSDSGGGNVRTSVVSEQSRKEHYPSSVVIGASDSAVVSVPLHEEEWVSDKKLSAADKHGDNHVDSPVDKPADKPADESIAVQNRKKSPENGFRGLFASIKKLGGSHETWQRRDYYEKKNPRNFSASVEFFDYKPNNPVVSNNSAAPVKSIMPVYRISQGVGRGGDVSVIFGHWNSSETDVLSSVYENDYSLAGATVSVTELLDQRVGFRAEAGLVEYVHKATVTNKALFGSIGSTARNMGYLFSAGLRYRINTGLDLSLTWMKFGGRFRHPDFGPTPVETEMGSSAFGFGVHYRF
jgi:LysM repeat protein